MESAMLGITKASFRAGSGYFEPHQLKIVEKFKAIKTMVAQCAGEAADVWEDG